MKAAIIAFVILAAGMPGGHAGDSAPIDEESAETWDCSFVMHDPEKLAECRADLPDTPLQRCFEYELTRTTAVSALARCTGYIED